VRRLALLAPLALLALATTSPAATSTYSSHQLHAAIPDPGSLVRTIDVPDSGPVSFVAVGVRIVHPRDSDLTLTLISPHGTAVIVSRRRGGDGADYGSGAKGCSGQLTWFQSIGSLDPISTGRPPFADSYAPEQPLTKLNGEEAHGRWSLRVDDKAAGEIGTLLCWQLQLSRDVVEHRIATRGPVTADLSFRETNSYYRDLRVTVRRRGVLALAAPVSRFACRDCAVTGVDTVLSPRPVSVRDLDGDGEPEVLLDLYTGGAHCCFYTVILRYDGRGYRGSVAFWGDPGYELRDLDGDGRPELVTADDRFAYQFSAYVFSILPVRVEHYDHGRLLDVTSRYPWLVRREARRLSTLYVKTHRQRDVDQRGLLAGWLADEYRLGRQDEGWRLIEAAYRRGELSAPRVDLIWPAGRKYLTALRAFLVKTGYTR
jgi:subtilisin-like proprotein convertase family protein